MTIKNPVEWGYDHARRAVGGLSGAADSIHHRGELLNDPVPAVRRIRIEDLGQALRRGFDDFVASRTDVLFIGLIYPLAGLLLVRLTSGYDMLPLVFPLLSGFALIGPFAATGLYEMSRLREAGQTPSWRDGFRPFGAPEAMSLALMGIILAALFFAWLGVAMWIYSSTIGPAAPASIGTFLSDVFTTSAGWMLIIAGMGIGFLFAVLVLSISVVTFPLLIDRKVGVGTAIATSMRAVATNPVPMGVWGLIVALGLAIGALPALLGLIVVVPVLGHATWHLYRRMVD